MLSRIDRGERNAVASGKDMPRSAGARQTSVATRFLCLACAPFPRGAAAAPLGGGIQKVNVQALTHDHLALVVVDVPVARDRYVYSTSWRQCHALDL